MELLTTHGAAVLFYIFAAGALASALLVVTLRNPMYCAISLLVTFLSVAALFVLRHAEFLAVVQIFVYGGGVMVLFLFVIMLVNLHRLREARLFFDQTPVVVGLVILLIAVFLYVVADAGLGISQAFAASLGEGGQGVEGNTEAVALRLFREFLLPFEVASVFLLVAMIGAVVLGRKE